MYKRIDKIENGAVVHSDDREHTKPTPRIYYKNLEDALEGILKEVKKSWQNENISDGNRFVEIRWS